MKEDDCGVHTIRLHSLYEWTCCPGLHTQHASATNAELHQGCMPWVLIKTAMPSQEVNSTPSPPFIHTHTHTHRPTHKHTFSARRTRRRRQTTERHSDHQFYGPWKSLLSGWYVCVWVLREKDYLVTPTWETCLRSTDKSTAESESSSPLFSHKHTLQWRRPIMNEGFLTFSILRPCTRLSEISSVWSIWGNVNEDQDTPG